MADEKSFQTDPGDREGAATELGGTLINEELYRRPSRAPDYEAENRALAALAQVMAESPRDLLGRLVEAALELCRADSAGISLLEEGGDHGIFRWHAISGAFAPNLYGTMPRELSACGTVLERDTALLFERPARHFTDLAGAEPPIHESLLVPLHSKGKTVGTVWAIAHSPERKFDSEDARLLESLSRLASAAYQMIRALDAAQEGKEKLELRVRERTGELASVNEALWRSETQLQTLFDEAPLGVYLVDGDFRIRQVNPAALPVFGNIPDLIGRDFDEVMHILWSQAYADELVERFQHTLETGESYFVVERIEQRRDSGVTEYYEWQINRITLPEGGYGVVCYFRDVSAPVLARQAIAESEENYRTLFEAIDEGFCAVEVLFDQNERPVDYRFLQVNPSFERQTGIVNAVGRRMREITPQREEQWVEIYGKVALTGEPVRFENQAAQLGRWYDVYAFRVGDPGLRCVGILFKDITERKRAEESQRRAAELDAFRVALADALRPLSDPVQIQAETCRLLGEHLGAERAYYVEISEAENYIRVNQDYVRGDAPSLVGVHDLSAYGWVVPIYRRGDAAIVADIENSELVPETDRKAMSAVGVAAFAAIPLVKAGMLAGALTVAESAPREWSETEIELVRETAERLWASVERARAEEALRRSQERMQRVLETEAVGVMFFDRTDTIIDANNAFLKITGYSRAEVESGELTWRRLTPPEWIPESEAQIAKLEATGRIGPYEKEYILKDGSRRWMLFAGRDLGDGTVSEYCIDVSDRKWAEEQLRASEERLRVLVESVHDYAIFTLDTEGRVTSWNEGARRTKGYTAEEIIGQPVSRFYTEEDVAAGKPAAEMETALREGRSEDESWRVHKDGSLLWINEIMTPLRADDGTLLGFTKISRDLTERKRAEERLRASEERLRLLIESAEDYAIFTLTPDNRVSYWNAGAERVFGYTEEEILGRSGAILFTPEDRERGVPEQEMRAAEAEGRASDERWHVSKNETRFYSSGVMTALRYGGELQGFAKIARDLTLQKRAEEELRRAHDELEERVRERTLELAESNVSLGEEVRERRAAEEQVKRLLRQLVTVQEEERLRIARDIHDQMGQQMSALRMSISSLHARCDGETELAEQSRRTLALAEELDQSIDFLTWELRPAALDHLGLSAALANLVQGWSERFHITAEYHASGVDSLRLPPDSEINLYRLAQEALHNVYKHAGATNVGVFLERRDGHVVLIVEDDGRGFDPEEVSHDGDGAGMGLIGMRERATLVGGGLDVESSPGSGTTVYVRVLLTLSGDGGAGR